MTVAVAVHERCIGTFCPWSSSMLGVHHSLIIVNKLLGGRMAILLPESIKVEDFCGQFGIKHKGCYVIEKLVSYFRRCDIIVYNIDKFG